MIFNQRHYSAFLYLDFREFTTQFYFVRTYKLNIVRVLNAENSLMQARVWNRLNCNFSPKELVPFMMLPFNLVAGATEEIFVDNHPGFLVEYTVQTKAKKYQWALLYKLNAYC